MRCCICGKGIIKYPHNANPLLNDYCCEECDNKFVIPYRIFLSGMKNPTCALWLKPNYELEVLKPKDKYFTLEELQKAVEGKIEIAPVKFDDCLVVVNEEGKIKKLPPNITGVLMFGWRFMGNILIVPEKIFEAPEKE